MDESSEPGNWGIEVLLFQEDTREPLRSLRNIDLWEPLVPGEPHDLVFPVGPLGAEGTFTFAYIAHLPGWEFTITQAQFTDHNPVGVYTATLTTIPPCRHCSWLQLPIVDVEGFLNGQPIGGFRKVDSPAVPLHVPADPIYAEREITINPYPVNAGEPTELCVELRNPTDNPQDVNGAILLGELRHWPALHTHRWTAAGAPAAAFDGQTLHPLGATSLRAPVPAGHAR